MKIRRPILLLAVTLASLVTGGWHGASSAAANADARVLRVASFQSGHHPAAWVLHWLSRQTPVRAAGLGQDGRTVEIRFRDGSTSLIVPASFGTMPLRGGRLRALTRVAAPSRAPGGRAVVLEPFATELGLGAGAGDPEVNALTATGFQVDQLSDAQVSVSEMASLYRYNVVYIHTHSGVNQAGEGVLATGQLANDDSSVAALLQSGSVIKVGVSGTNDIYYGITSLYIQQYEGQFPQDSLLFLNGCNLLSASLFWKALQAKGAAVMVSWDREATSQDNYLGAAAFFTEMRQGQTVSAAIQAEQAAGYGKSTAGGQTASMGFLGDGSVTLQRAASGGSGAPVTKPTPTVTPRPTATAAPRATPPAGPALAVTLQPRVKPGKKQVISISSRPGATIQIQVTFPNGDLRQAKLTADTNGRARYAYQQLPSEVTHQRVFATVTVSAQQGAGISTVSSRYRIGWSPVDVSALPRRQAIGKFVGIWVHTRARTPVRLALVVRHGKTHPYRLRTGRRGWAHLRYKVPHPKGGKTPRRVQVVVTVRLGRASYQAQAAFTIV